eukprot:1145130-Pelagomonas_calceolata.AAC.2
MVEVRLKRLKSTAVEVRLKIHLLKFRLEVQIARSLGRKLVNGFLRRISLLPTKLGLQRSFQLRAHTLKVESGAWQDGTSVRDRSIRLNVIGATKEDSKMERHALSKLMRLILEQLSWPSSRASWLKVKPICNNCKVTGVLATKLEMKHMSFLTVLNKFVLCVASSRAF